jgi:hypothetical protein
LTNFRKARRTRAAPIGSVTVMAARQIRARSARAAGRGAAAARRSRPQPVGHGVDQLPAVMDGRAAPRLGGRDRGTSSCHSASVRSVAYGRRGGVAGGFLSDGIKIAADHMGFQAPSQAMRARVRSASRSARARHRSRTASRPRSGCGCPPVPQRGATEPTLGSRGCRSDPVPRRWGSGWARSPDSPLPCGQQAGQLIAGGADPVAGSQPAWICKPGYEPAHRRLVMGDPLDLRHLGQAQDPTEMMSPCTSRPRTDVAVGGSNPSRRALLLGSGRATCAAGFRDAPERVVRSPQRHRHIPKGTADSCALKGRPPAPPGSGSRTALTASGPRRWAGQTVKGVDSAHQRCRGVEHGGSPRPLDCQLVAHHLLGRRNREAALAPCRAINTFTVLGVVRVGPIRDCRLVRCS